MDIIIATPTVLFHAFCTSSYTWRFYNKYTTTGNNWARNLEERHDRYKM